MPRPAPADVTRVAAGVALMAGPPGWGLAHILDQPAYLAGGATITAAALGGAVGWWRWCRAHDPGETATRPWGTRLDAALTDAGLLPAAKPGEPAPHLRRLGRPHRDGAGTAVKVRLPGGRTLADVAERLPNIASSLHLPAGDIHVTQDPTDAASDITIWFVDRARKQGTTAARIADATDWHQPIRIGRTRGRGEPVHLLTDEHNCLVAGVMGFGKTSLARIVAAHALLDHAAQVHVIDGKGSRRDWGDCRDACATFILGSDPDAIDRIVAMLDGILAEVQRRNATSHELAAGERPPGILIVGDEWQDVRSAAPPKVGQHIDTVLGRILRTGRASGVHLLLVTQRPQAGTDLPSGIRNLVDQRIALVTSHEGDAKLILGATPAKDLPMPARRGEAILSAPTGMTAVALDFLDEAGWKAVCRRACEIRAAENAAVTVPAGIPLMGSQSTEGRQAPSLAAAVREALASAEGQRARPSELMMMLPPDVRPADVRTLGMQLAEFGVRSRVLNGGRFYRLADIDGTANGIETG